jgi:predicted aspartyl protease
MRAPVRAPSIGVRLDILLAVLLQGYVVVENISINGKGNYRFLVDTGSQSTAIDESLAQELSLTPTYRVHLTTPASSRLVNATKVRNIAAEGFSVKDVEVLWYNFAAEKAAGLNIQGILGNNVLAHMDYILDVGKGVLRPRPASGAEEVKGDRIFFRLDEGRVVVPVRLSADGIAHDFVLDSGASTMVLPRELAPVFQLRSPARLRTAAGEEDVEFTTLPCVYIGGVAVRNVPAVIQRVALLPARIFTAIYVNSTSRYLILNPMWK